MKDTVEPLPCVRAHGCARTHKQESARHQSGASLPHSAQKTSARPCRGMPTTLQTCWKCVRYRIIASQNFLALLKFQYTVSSQKQSHILEGRSGTSTLSVSPTSRDTERDRGERKRERGSRMQKVRQKKQSARAHTNTHTEGMTTQKAHQPNYSDVDFWNTRCKPKP